MSRVRRARRFRKKRARAPPTHTHNRYSRCRVPLSDEKKPREQLTWHLWNTPLRLFVDSTHENPAARRRPAARSRLRQAAHTRHEHAFEWQSHGAPGVESATAQRRQAAAFCPIAAARTEGRRHTEGPACCSGHHAEVPKPHKLLLPNNHCRRHRSSACPSSSDHQRSTPTAAAACIFVESAETLARALDSHADRISGS